MKIIILENNKSSQQVIGLGIIAMPVVIIEMWEGRTVEQKEKLIQGITRVFEDIGTKPESLHIIMHDVPKTNWGTRGEQASKLT